MDSPTSFSLSNISSYLPLSDLPMNHTNLKPSPLFDTLPLNDQSSLNPSVSSQQINPFHSYPNFHFPPQTFPVFTPSQTTKSLLTLRPFPFPHINQRPDINLNPAGVPCAYQLSQASNDSNIANTLYFQIKQNYGALLGAGSLNHFDQFNFSKRKKSKHWTKEEDDLLMDLIQKYGLKWCKMEPYFVDRKSKQIRDRYMNYLRPDIKQQKWTQEEDNKLIEHYRRLGNKWTKIAQMLPGRPENQVKNRFYSTLINRLKKLPLKQEIKNEEEFVAGKKIKTEANSENLIKYELASDEVSNILRVKFEQDSPNTPSIESTGFKKYKSKKKTKSKVRAKTLKNGTQSNFSTNISIEIPSYSPQNMMNIKFNEGEFSLEEYLKLEVNESDDKTKIEFDNCQSEF